MTEHKAHAPMHTAMSQVVRIPMHDGVSLEAEISFPSQDGEKPAVGPFSTLLMRTPYNRRVWSMMPLGLVATTEPINLRVGAEHGYVVIYQDVRGTFGSEGLFEPLLNEGPDGVDTVAWIQSQPWSNGQVGTFGPSYMGGVQMLLAAEVPKALVATYSQASAGDQFEHDWPYVGGVLSQALAVQWSAMEALDNIRNLPTDVQARIEADFVEIVGTPLDNHGPFVVQSPAFASVLKSLLRMTPICDLPILRHVQWFCDWLDNRENPAHFKANAMRDRFVNHAVPTMHVGGWYDVFLRNTLSHYQGITTQARDANARANQRMVIGPWSHAGCVDSPPGAAIDGQAMAIAWMDRWMRDVRHPSFDHNVVLYIQGENRWRAEDSWPLPGTEQTRYYLHSRGRANTANGDGDLSTMAPGDEMPDRYTYDPADPVPTLGGISISGSRAAQNVIEARDDVLCYTTPALIQDVEVTGTVTATLFAVTSAVDTDWWLRLVDVGPDGTAATLNHGFVRARYRHSRTSPEPVNPGEVVQYTVDMQATSNVFKAGHRIRVDVSSSCFPLGERNPNTMIDPATAIAADFVVAEQTVFHDADHSSYVDLPIIPLARERHWIDTPFPLASGVNVNLPVPGY